MTTTVTLISRAADGTAGDYNPLFTNSPPVFSPDGTKVAFVSRATNLVPGDTNLKYDIFVKDVRTGAITLVSRASDGTIGNGDSDSPVFSPDGTKIVFSSTSSNLVAGDTNASADIFVEDLSTGAISIVSRASDGSLATGASTVPVFSPDGTKVAFRSQAAFVADDVNGAPDVYVKDLSTGAITLATRLADGSTRNGGTNPFPVFSPDGAKVAFDSSVYFVADANGNTEIYIKNLSTGAIDLVSRAADGTVGNGASQSPVFSPDGTKIAFYSGATNLVAGDTNNRRDIFVKDLNTNAVTLVSRASDGTIGDGDSYFPVFSADGTKIAFASQASNLVAGDTNGTQDIFVKDLTTGAITMISRAADGTIENGSGVSASFSPNGASLAFTSSADNLVAGTNPSFNIFVVSNNPAPTIIVGTAASETLTGTAATDVIYGLGGNDTLIGGFAAPGESNQLWGGSGSDTASYSAMAVSVTADLRGGATIGGVLVDTYNSIENLIGGSAGDVLIGTDPDNNILDGGAGSDVLYGLDGNDTLIGGTAAVGSYNQLWGGAGNDTASYAGTGGKVYASIEGSSAYVDSGGGYVITDAYNSIENLTGGSGNDTLIGDAGANRLQGGAGSDQLYGRGGADTFVYGAYSDSTVGGGYDTIADFQSGIDTLDLTALGLTAGQIQIATGGGSTSVYALHTPGAFNPATDLAISFIGANAINLADIQL
jgi:Tol biopolymer transport system component